MEATPFDSEGKNRRLSSHLSLSLPRALLLTIGALLLLLLVVGV